MKQVFEADDFNELYKSLVAVVLKSGNEVTVRSEKTYELLNQQIVLTDIKRSRLDFSKTNAYWRQRDYDSYLKKELAWYESGSLKAETAPAKVWKKFSDSQGNVQSNYGHLILHHTRDYSVPAVTPYQNVLSLLKGDQFSRQALLHYNLPEHYRINPKDVPCTVCSQVFIRENRLNFSVFQRSCDMYTGLVYDLPWHCYLLEKMAHDLQIEYVNLTAGSITMFFGSVHIYERDLSFFKDFQQERIGKSA